MPTLPDVVWRGIFSSYRELVGNCTEACDEYHFGTLATVIGTVIGRRVGGWYGRPVFPNFFTVLVGDTGVSRKSTAASLGLKLLKDMSIPLVHTIHSVSTAEGLLSHMGAFNPDEDPPRDSWNNILHIDELATLLRKARQDFSSNLPPMLTNMYDSPDAISLPTRKAPLTLQKPFISILSSTTPEWLESSIQEEEVMGGFSNRFVYYTGYPKPANPFPDSPDQDMWMVLADMIKSLHDTEVRMIYMSDNAKRLWKSFYTDWRNQKFPGILGQIIERVPEQIFKMALLYAVTDGEVEISDVSMSAALAWGNYAIQSSSCVYGNFPLSSAGKVEAKILQLLSQNNNIMSISDIHRQLSGRVRADQFWYIIGGLQQAERIELIKTGQKSFLKLRQSMEIEVK